MSQDNVYRMASQQTARAMISDLEHEFLERSKALLDEGDLQTVMDLLPQYEEAIRKARGYLEEEK